MMTPRMEDIIEFVRTGETDPEMAETLRSHPDRDELLKQARFICRMVQMKDEGASDSRPAAGAAKLAGLFEARAAAREELVLYQEAVEEPRKSKRRKRIPADGLPGPGYLGALIGITKDDRVELTYMPSRVALRHWDVGDDWYVSDEAQAEGIEVRGAGITISAPDSVAVGEALPIGLVLGERAMPARRLKLVYMPESGPFVELETDDEGRIDMTLPERPGILRIDLPLVQMLEFSIKH